MEILSFVASNTIFVDLRICEFVISHPAIVPPENRTAEPVMSPLPLMLKLEADIK